MSIYQPSEALENLVRQLTDQTIDQSGIQQLESILQQDQEARRWYLQETSMHSALYRWAGRQTETSADIKSDKNPLELEQEIRSVEEILELQKRRNRRTAILSAAAIIAIGVMIMQLFWIDTTRPPALAFLVSPGTQFTITHDRSEESPAARTMERGSRLQLSQGTVELTFENGVKSIVMAPADMTLHDDDQLYLGEGTAWFHVPQGAEGFQVKTKELKIVDLGTKFGVLAKPNQHDEIHVLQGKVEASTLRIRKESATLTTGQARRIDPVGRLTTIPIQANTFLTKLPTSLPHLHWSFDGDDPFTPKGSLPEIKTIVTEPIQSDSRPAFHRLVAGKNNKALLFDGKGDQIKTNWPGILGREPRSVACWIKIHPQDPHGWAPIVEWGQMNNNHYWRFRITKSETDPTRAVLRLGLGQSWYDGTTNLADGKWHHVAVVDTGELNASGTPDIRFYVDGQDEPAVHQKSSRIVHSRKTEEGFPMVMGINHRPYSAHYQARLHGTLDELFIFRATLTPSSIQQIMSTHQP